MSTISVDGLNMFYELKGSGEPILFLHGLGSSTIDWEYQIDYFANHYQTITLDMRGHGQTAKPKGPYSISMFAKDVAAFIKALELPRVHVVGISMGGMIALQLASDNQELLKSLVVVNSLAHYKLKTPGDYYGFYKRLLLIRFLGMAKIGEVIGGNLFPEEHQANIRKVFKERWAKNDKSSYAAAMKAIVKWSVEDGLEHIQIPTLIVTGDQDYSPVSEKAALVKRLANAKLTVIENSRHGTPIDQAEQFNKAVDDFLKASTI